MFLRRWEGDLLRWRWGKKKFFNVLNAENHVLAEPEGVEQVREPHQ